MGKITIKTKKLFDENPRKAIDVVRAAGVSLPTAYRLMRGEAAEGITFDVLAAICDLFDVGVGDVLEYVPDTDGATPKRKPRKVRK